MKRYIYSTLSEIKVEVYLDQYYVPVVLNSSIKPIQPDYPIDNSVDEQALADYNSFIEDTKAELEDLDLEIIDSNNSKRSLASKYFTLVDLEQHVKYTLRYLIFLRISNHSEADFGDEQVDVDKAIREHRERIQKRISNEQGHRVVWKVREIIVNGERFSSYDDAVDYIRRLAEDWSKLVKSHPYKE